jgi:hypothetical protein
MVYTNRMKRRSEFLLDVLLPQGPMLANTNRLDQTRLLI